MIMKNKNIKKQGTLIFVRTISIMLVFGIIVYSIYAYITLANEKQNQQNEANEIFYELREKINNYYDENSITSDFGSLTYTIQNYSDADTKIMFYSDIIPGSSNKSSLAYVSNNSFPFKFIVDNSSTGISSTIEYECFRNSMSEDVYEEICEYINRKPDVENNNERYILSCTEAYLSYYTFQNYLNSGTFHPSKLQILKIDDNIDWYIQAEIVKEYTLDNDNINTDESSLLSIGDVYMNEIEKDFFEGNYYQCNITDDEIDDVNKHSGEGELYNLGCFNYILQNAFIKGYDIKMPNNVYEVKYDEFRFYHKINLLEICKNELITMLIYIIITFTGIGILIALMSWRTLKKQMSLEEKRRELTNSMAHDLKTPLFIIGGYAENLLENVRTDKKDHYAQMIYEKTQEMNGLVHNMLELSKLENNSINPNKEEFDLVESTKDILVQFMTANNFNISLEGTDTAIIIADRDLIKRAITNLIRNAEKYSEDRKASITISSNEFRISNACTKIKAKDIKKLWAPYYMGNNSVRNKGNGLGLSIVKNIMQAHQFEFGARLENKTIIFYFRF